MSKILLYVIAILLLIIIIGGGYTCIRMHAMGKTIDKLENKINLQVNNYGKGPEILKEYIQDPRIDSLLKISGIKPKNVQAVTNVEYHSHNHFKSDSLIRIRDTSICVEYKYKGWSLRGCNGSYEDDRTFKATGILHRKPTKRFLFIKYCKKPVLQSWTEYGDSLNIELVER